MKASYYDYPALPLVSRPFNGWMAARALLPHVRSFAPDLIFSCFLYPDGYAALKIGKALSVPVVARALAPTSTGSAIPSRPCTRAPFCAKPIFWSQ